ncbi:MAG: hypothetical protein M3375_09610 [Actinomycetota bacterium]|nr:hypothetical protein [Actinomycetota bacterium]
MRAAPAAALALILVAGCDLEESIGPGDNRMPAVVGKTATKANIALNSRGFTPSYGKQVPFDSDRCRVVVQKTPPGSTVRPYSTQQIRCVVRVPAILGRTADDAESSLEKQGLDPKFVNGPRASRRGRCRVVRRSGGRLARPQDDIRIRLRC